MQLPVDLHLLGDDLRGPPSYTAVHEPITEIVEFQNFASSADLAASIQAQPFQARAPLNLHFIFFSFARFSNTHTHARKCGRKRKQNETID